MHDEIPVFDGHNDVLLRLSEPEGDGRSFLERGSEGHLDLPRAREGGFVGGLFAIFTPSSDPPERIDSPDGYETPLPAAPDLAQAQRHTLALAADLYRLERDSNGGMRVCRSVPEIAAAVADGALAVVMHIEGAEAIDEEFDALEVFYRAGLRSLGLAWSRSNAFATGVPFNYPGSPDIGAGLSDRGKELVRACNRLGVMVDLSHLNERGFWDVAAISDKPLVASHSNAHAICPVPRNLTDAQLEAVGASGGLVGINFATSFLEPGGSRDADLPLEVMVRHVDHMVERLGIGGVGLGSDFDGATVPAAIGDVSGLPRLIGALREHGYDDETLRRICFENWLDVLERSWT